ncbi:hypothetical protein ACHHYP_05091 [Achlya hypogyna]|uniref:Secreted protein n=1 Tax=Achlya hypogyna TaxID=1202772 RepID=A0A0A7CNC2_ACHHY|nr:secreted protein [Achlya hypogyna]OQR90980.1 hypothetical protein ACHHYP_05091 [Achlya hypogyna]
MKLLSLIFVGLGAVVVDTTSLQTATCVANCPPIKQTYCALETPTATTMVNKYTSQCNCLLNKCKNKKVQCLSATTTTCDSTCTRKIAKCKPNEIKPVCGSNGVTYDNLCFLKAARCLKPEIQFIAPGKCPKKMTTCGIAKCPLTKAKVCASMDGGKTQLKYQNQCFLDAATCVNPLIKKIAACKGRRMLHAAAANATLIVDEADSDLDDDVGSIEIPEGDEDDFLIIDDLMDATTTVPTNGTDTPTNGSTVVTPATSTGAPSKTKSSASMANAGFVVASTFALLLL